MRTTVCRTRIRQNAPLGGDNDLDLSQRAPAAVQWLDNLEGDLDVDQMCFAITIAEQVGMYGDGEDEDVEATEGSGPAEQPRGYEPREP